MDSLLLHALANRQRYASLRAAVPDSMLSQDTVAMLGWYALYWHSYPERQDLLVDELVTLIRLRAVEATPEQLALTLRLCDGLRVAPDPEAVRGVLSSLQELDLAGKAAAIITRFNRGEEIHLAHELNKLASGAVRSIAAGSPDTYIDRHIDEILSDINNDKGIKLRRTKLLREGIAGLQGGASIAIGARPDKGKTSWIADMLTDIAPQVPEFFGEGRPILWLNNEGNGQRIIPRLYQAALRMTLDEIIALSNRGVLVQEYAKVVGRPDIIRVKDMHGASLPMIEQVLESMNPAIVVYDMLANFRLGGPANGANKADAVEQAWQEVREMAVRHSHIAFSTVQISVEGGNMLYPPYSALKDSKTGIQGATDVILLLGSLDNPDAASIRGLSTPKNKFQMPGKPSYLTGEVYFDSARCVFDDGTGNTAHAPN